MKYLKSFEKLQKLPQIGDYVISKDSFFSNEDGILDFLDSNVGQIKNIDKSVDGKNGYDVVYQNIPKKLVSYFDWNDSESKIYMREKEIIYFSHDKNEIELKLISKKFNI